MCTGKATQADFKLAHIATLTSRICTQRQSNASVAYSCAGRSRTKASTLDEQSQFLCDAILAGEVLVKELSSAIVEVLKQNAAAAEVLVTRLVMDAKDEMLSADEEEPDSDENENNEDDEGEDDADGEDRDPIIDKGTKRKAGSDEPSSDFALVLKWKTCAHCHQLYNHNRPNACRYHPGEREVIWESEAWADNDNDYPEDHINECPEGFLWSCCGQTGNRMKGCIKSAHEPLRANKRKK